MPSVSRQSAAESMRMFGLEARLSNLEGGFTVSFETHTSDEDLGPLLEGLPNDECQFVRLGYVVRGTAEFRFGGGRIEIYNAGEAYSVPVGHSRSTTKEPRSWSSARRTSSARRSASSSPTSSAAVVQ